MGKLVIVCVALFVLAAGLVILNQAQDLVVLYNAFWAEPLLAQVAWAIVVLVPIVLLPTTVLLWDTLVRHRKAGTALEQRLDGVRQGVKEMTASQFDVEAAVKQLDRTDPENAMSAAQHRLTEAERVAQVQQSRHEFGDLQSRIDDIRAQQQALHERLTPVLDKRRSIEQLFLELDTRQTDIERSLAEIASGDDSVALDAHLKNLTESVRHNNERCEEIERASMAVGDLKKAFAELHTRLVPLAAVEGGVASRLKELTEDRDGLTGKIGSLLQTSQGGLVMRIQAFAEDKKKLDDDVANIDLQFSKLATLRKDFEGLFAHFDRALDTIATSTGADGAADPNARVAEVTEYVKATQTHIDEVGRKLISFGQLRTKLGELQSQLVPLNDDVAKLDLEFSKLGTLRKDIEATFARFDQALDTIGMSASEGGTANADKRVEEVSEFVKVTQAHVDDIGRKLVTFSQLKTKLGELQSQLVPLSGEVANLDPDFAKLGTLRRDIETVFAHFDHALDTIGTSTSAGGAADADTRVAEVSEFLKATQAHVDDIRRKLVTFSQLRTKLSELQSQLAPLEAANGGVLDIIGQVEENRERLEAKVGHLEEDEANGNLSARVKTLTDSKQELEERVATVTEHYSKLHTIRKDIAGLFEKLNSAATPSN